MYTQDYFSNNVPVWNRLFQGMRHRPNLNFLEIGCFEGRSAVWLLENVLTDPTSTLHCIDTFEGSEEHDAIDTSRLREYFMHNIEDHRSKVVVHVGESGKVLRTFRERNVFDFIYIDGDHHSANVMEDAVLCFPLLKVGGIMAFDDYLGGDGETLEYQLPKIAVDAFLKVYQKKVVLKHMGYQVFVEKVED